MRFSFTASTTTPNPRAGSARLQYLHGSFPFCTCQSSNRCTVISWLAAWVCKLAACTGKRCMGCNCSLKPLMYMSMAGSALLDSAKANVPAFTASGDPRAKGHYIPRQTCLRSRSNERVCGSVVGIKEEICEVKEMTSGVTRNGGHRFHT